MRGRVLLVLLVVVMVNLPYAHGRWQDHRLDGSGVEVTGRVTDHDAGERFVTFAVPGRGEDRPAFGGTVRLRPAAYAAAVRRTEVAVRVLPGSTTVWRVAGEERGGVGVRATLAADALLVVAVLLLLRFGSRLRQEMVLVATEDLERCPPGSVLDQVDGLRFVVCGEVEEVEDDAVVLDLGDRRVRVVLDGHRNPAGPQQPVRATGVLQA